MYIYLYINNRRRDIESNINSSDYWEFHYDIKEFNDSRIYPSFLKDYIQKILEAGKSFNLIKELSLKKVINLCIY